MIFTVTYRGADGAMRTETLEAASRKDCFSQCRTMGITPMSVKEGAQSGGASKGGRASRSTGDGGGSRVRRPARGRVIACILSVAFAVLVAGGLWWWFAGRECAQAPSPKPPSALPKAVKPAAAAQVAPATNAPPKYVPTPLPEDWKYMTKAERAEWRKEDAKRNPRPPQPAPTMFSASSLRRKKDAPPPTFNNQIHADLACYLQVGRDVPPPGRITDAEALAAADMKINYYDSDSDAVLEEKKAVEEMLAEMKEYIQQGGHANEYFEKLAHRQQMEAEAVSETRRNVRALVKEGKMAEAKAALETYNAYLKGKGIPPVKVKGIR